MIAGLLPAARIAVDSRRFEIFRERRTEQEVVDADSGVALERVPPVMPEGVDSLVRMELA